ncbi:MAG: glycolate oxidase subunit GlcF [Proteobacteria bacterium]|nr:glycolate oxidase subunit GlcF [Pseudomonadota bacterium]
METRLADWIRDTPTGTAADEILRKCVHCGFCLATCPTYQILGDELDGPRGRIYQIKQVLEGAPAQRATQLHLDRCLTCRNCETTCPSGVQYGHLVDIGRAVVAKQVERPWRERALRWLLRESLPRPWLFGTALKLGRSVRWVLPRSVRNKVGVTRPPGPIPSQTHARKVLLLNNCVQPAMAPSIDAATARVLDATGVQSIIAPGSGCCGAIRQHLDDHDGARNNMRRNIDAWWPLVESGQVEAIVINASGCGAMVKDYGHLLSDDPAYATKANRIVESTRDIAEFLAGCSVPAAPRAQRVAFHPPCTLQHGQKIRGQVETLLRSLGAELVPVRDAHLCCGSAGTYSILQTELSQELRERKIDALQESVPEVILSANIGCIAHLQGGTEIPVRHWIEWLDERCRK